MNCVKSSNEGSSLIKGNATKSNAVDIPQISLPKGGGALKGIDEKFSVNPSNGTAAFSIPLPFSPGRNGFLPPLSLNYNSGSGNSDFGLGWNLSFPSIQRKTDKMIPQYGVGENEDIFMFSGEDLVPYLEEQDDLSWASVESIEGNYIVKRYRPRREDSSSKIEQITHIQNGMYWKVTAKNNVVTFFGKDVNCRICDPVNNDRIFQWLPEVSFDDRGNWIQYGYKQEDFQSVSNDPHEINRKNGQVKFTNKYLKKVSYGNKIPYYMDVEKLYTYMTESISTAPSFFTIAFDYGEHDQLKPKPEEEKDKSWDARSDAFSNYKAGFELRTYRLCKRILFFHQFEELNNDPCLVRSMDFEYSNLPDKENQENSIAKLLEATYLVSITQKGYIKKPDGSYSEKSFPALEFEYQSVIWNSEIKSVKKESMINSPVGLSDNYHWVDLYSEGISGIFTEKSGAWFYKSNLGDLEEAGSSKFTVAQLVSQRPSFTGIGQGVLQFQDLEGNGEKQIVLHSPGVHGFFEINDEDEWLPFQSFAHNVNLDLSDPHVKLLDLNGDGLPDILVSEDEVFLWYASKGKDGYAKPHFLAKTFNEEEGPTAIFTEGQEGIYFADMSGDGMSDILRIRNGEVCYWPNLGYGKFGAKVMMSNAPYFDFPDLFDPENIYLADITGTGATDILYLGNKFKAWVNLSGNGFSNTQEIEPAFPMEAGNKLSVIDLLGKGTACLVWSSELPAYREAPMQYMDLMGGKKPHVMIKYWNNLGKETKLEYKSSTWYYLNDKQSGKPWSTKLPFPVQCVSKLEVVEKISNVRFTTEYAYHHGYYDHAEREFRGFGMVEQKDSESYSSWKINNKNNLLDSAEVLFQKPVLTKTWYHLGNFRDQENILNTFEHQYWYEEMNRQGYRVAALENKLPDAVVLPISIIKNPRIIENLTKDEWREAFRACKGMMLRQEVFCLDAPETDSSDEAMKLQLAPYTVVTHNCTIQLLQPRNSNQYAVFQVMEREAISYHYDREIEDPRITHSLNIDIDDYGNVVESAKICYPRSLEDNDLEGEINDFVRKMQQKTSVIFTKNTYTNDVLTNGAYRLRQLWETKAYEITCLPKHGPLYQVEDFKGTLLNDEVEVKYHLQDDMAKVDLQENGSQISKHKIRLIECLQTLYYKNDLTGPLTKATLESTAIPYENYQLAYTLELVKYLYQEKLNSGSERLEDVLKESGKFLQREDNNWWIPSGTVRYLNEKAEENETLAKSRFYCPISYTDPCSSTTTVKYYKDYYLFVEEVEDQLGNITKVENFDFRILAPTKIKDINDNLSEVITDELGIVKALAVMGKGKEADYLNELKELYSEDETSGCTNFFNQEDSVELQNLGKGLLKQATIRFVYDFDRYKNEGKPVVVASIKREKHSCDEPGLEATTIQLSFEYSDGMGKVVMTKIQAEPGKAKKMVGNTVTEFDTATLIPRRLRWIGTGRVVLNNKGNPVKQYEPYFSVSPFYEDAQELVETGVTPIFYYDSLSRLIKTEYPDRTYSNVEFTPWKQRDFDRNDTVKDSRWYDDRIQRKIDGKLTAAGKDPLKEQEAAQRASAHDQTPLETHFDNMGRSILTEEHNKDDVGTDLFYYTKVELDIEGNVRKIMDARGNTVMEYKNDMLGHRVYENSMDAGERWVLNDVLGHAIRRWDGRNHTFSFRYDELHRPIEMKVSGGDGELLLDNIYEKVIYGEGQEQDKERNLRGKPYLYYDTAGEVLFEHYDFKGNNTKSLRRFAQDYKKVVNWSGNPDELDKLLDIEKFGNEIEYDALSRVIRSTTPDQSITRPIYNEAGLLETVHVRQENKAEETYVQNIDYDEKGRRKFIKYGNGLKTTYDYDSETFQLIHVETVKSSGERLQRIKFTYDPVGNITHIQDEAIPEVFFNNQKTDGTCEFCYDSLYRLIKAQGREHQGQVSFGANDNYDDFAYSKKHSPNDPLSWRVYTQKYVYDEVGNILLFDHNAKQGNFTRRYDYERETNRLKATRVGNGTFGDYAYTYHLEHGFMTSMPHLQMMEWNFKNELSAVSKQRRVDGGRPETTYYLYDSQGQRVRKITEKTSTEGVNPSKKNERIYVGGIEIYREYAQDIIDLERQTLHVMDDKTRIAMIETRTRGTDEMPERLIRYQFGNHLGSACLETDEREKVISYEEYHPYGTTAYQAVDKDTKAAAKRYRYTGKERDEESGFYYHGARYYVPWLVRWVSCDPARLVDGVNIYKYARNNPVIFTDSNGLAAEPQSDLNYNNGKNFEKEYKPPKGHLEGNGVAVQPGKGGSIIDHMLAKATSWGYAIVGTIEDKTIDLTKPKYLRDSGVFRKGEIERKLNTYLDQMVKHMEALDDKGYINELTGKPLKENLRILAKTTNGKRFAEFKQILNKTLNEFNKTHGTDIKATVTRNMPKPKGSQTGSAGVRTALGMGIPALVGVAASAMFKSDKAKETASDVASNVTAAAVEWVQGVGLPMAVESSKVLASQGLQAVRQYGTQVVTAGGAAVASIGASGAGALALKAAVAAGAVGIAAAAGYGIGTIINSQLSENAKTAIGGTMNEIINEGGWKEIFKHPFGIGL